MINTRASTTGTVVRLKMGWEGPSWDPYSYDRITVKRDGHEATYHCGLGEWLKIDGCEIEDIEENPEAVDKMLWDTIGMDFATLKQLQALIESKPLRCECGKPKIGFGVE